MELGDLGVAVAVRGGGGGAAADLFICSAVCVQEPERDRSSWEQKKPPGGAGGPSTSAAGPDTKAEPPAQERLEGASLPPPQKGFSGALMLVSAMQTPVCHPRLGQHPHRGVGGEGPLQGQGPGAGVGSVLTGGSVLPRVRILTGEQGSPWGQSRPGQHPRVSSGTDIPRLLSALTPL